MAEVKTISLINGVTVTAPNDLSSSSGGGGGGGGLQWNPVEGEAPQSVQENSERVYLFENGITQKLSVWLKVPSSYIAGSQITMRLAMYSPSAANTIFMTTTAYLVREGTDGTDSVANSHASTNSALTNTVANQYREFTTDIGNASGQINSVGVSPSDLIRIDLVRDADTDTADLRFIPSATEVTFI